MKKQNNYNNAEEIRPEPQSRRKSVWSTRLNAWVLLRDGKSLFDVEKKIEQCRQHKGR